MDQTGDGVMRDGDAFRLAGRAGGVRHITKLFGIEEARRVFYALCSDNLGLSIERDGLSVEGGNLVAQVFLCQQHRNSGIIEN